MTKFIKISALALGVFGLLAISGIVNAATQVKPTFPQFSSFELKDVKSGDVYCVWIKLGLWYQVKAKCGSKTVTDMGGPSSFSNSVPVDTQSKSSTNLAGRVTSLETQIAAQQKEIDSLESQLNPTSQQNTTGTQSGSVNIPSTQNSDNSQSLQTETSPSTDSATSAAPASFLNSIANFLKSIFIWK